MKAGQPLTPGREVVAVLACLAVFALLCRLRALGHPYPFYDDVAYLAAAEHVRDLGGPWAMVQGLFAGTYREDQRNPLYLGLLSLIADREPAFHLRAQALNAALGIAMLLAWWAVARRRFGPGAALVLLAFLAASETAIAWSSHEACEPLLMIFWALGMGAALAGRRGWIWAGAFAGLAWLTKGTGIFLLFCLVIAALLQYRLRALREVRFWSAVAAFAAFSSPLLVRNLRFYGNPLHNFSNRLLWMDRLADYSELFAPHALESAPIGPASYLSRTPLADLFERAARGLGETAVHFADAMSLVAPEPFGVVHIALLVVGLGSAAFALVLLRRAPPRFHRTFLLVHTAWFFAFFVLYNDVSGSSRYLFPAAVPLAAVAAAGLQRIARPGLARGLAAVAFSAVLASFALDRSPHAVPPGFGETQQWLLAHLQPGETYAIDSRSHLQPLWLIPRDARQLIVSASARGRPVDARELYAWLREQRVRYAIIDGASHASGQPRFLFYDQVERTADGSLPLSGWPAGLRVVHASAEVPRRWVVVEVADEPVLSSSGAAEASSGQ